MNKKKVLVSGVGGPAGINISRLLKAKVEYEIELIGCDIDSHAAGRNFVDEFLLSPRVSYEPAYQQWLQKITQEREIDLFIPTVDEELVPLSKFVDTMGCFTPLSSSETLQIASDKLASYQFVSEYLPQYAPQYCTLADWTEDWSTDDHFFIKPRFGRGARGCRLVDRSELSWIKNNATNPADIIVMENLPGAEFTVDAYVTQNGELTYLIPRERIGLAGGISIKGRTVNDQAIIEATKLLFDKLSFCGPVCVQWKLDKDNQLKFIEINPRLSGGLMISVIAGIDPVESLWSDMHGLPTILQSWREVTVVGHFDYKEIVI